MKKERVDIISEYLGVKPIEINSSLVSGQNRKRLYWTNIPGITQPEDKGILLKDVLQDQVDEEYYYSNERRNKILARKYEVTKRLEELNSKCATLVTTGGGDHEKKIAVSHCPASREFDGQGFRTDKVPTLCARDYKDAKVAVELISVQDGEIRVKTATKKWYEVANDGDGINLRYATSTTRRGRVARGKSHTLTTQNEADVLNNMRIRKLTPIEYERLQTLPDNYTEGVSKTQRYKMLGNGRTVDVIKHIFSFIPNK